MSLKILTWNVRGLNLCSRRMVVHKMIQMIRAPIVILQETKMARLGTLRRFVVIRMWAGQCNNL